MPTAIHTLMSSPPVTCAAVSTLAEAAVVMDGLQIGSVMVTEGEALVGILTERDLLRASASGVDAASEPIGRWMTNDPDVLGPDDDAATAWASPDTHRYRHLPVVDHGSLVGVVSLRDLVTESGAAVAPSAPSEGLIEVPAGLDGVVVAETSIGDVRGAEGFFHYRQYSATELAARRSLEDVAHLLLDGDLPGPEEADRFAADLASRRQLPPALAALLPQVAALGTPLDGLRTGVSLLGGALGWPPTHDIDAATLRDQALTLCAVVPTLLAAVHRIRSGHRPVPPRTDLSTAANYLWMLSGEEAPAAQVRAIEQYLILTIDHGFNASAFTGRVITSTGADLAGAIVGTVAALSGPLHGGAPSRALDMLDAIGSPDRAEEWIRTAVLRGDRIMGFGHRVYKTDDPRSTMLREVTLGLGGDLVDFATSVERAIVEVLAELKPGRQLYTNVEFYAGVVMHSCGIPREMFTPTFAASRTIGWASHVMEQAAANRLIRPVARYVGPPPPQPVPPA